LGELLNGGAGQRGRLRCSPSVRRSSGVLLLEPVAVHRQHPPKAPSSAPTATMSAAAFWWTDLSRARAASGGISPEQRSRRSRADSPGPAHSACAVWRNRGSSDRRGPADV